MRQREGYGRDGLFGLQIWIEQSFDFSPWDFVGGVRQNRLEFAAFNPVVNGLLRHVENCGDFGRPEPGTDRFVHSTSFR